MLIDTHAHLYWDSYKNNLDEVIQRSVDAGVTTIINAGVDVKLSKKALEQVEGELSKFEGLTSYCQIAIHPHKAVKYHGNPTVSIHKDIEQLEHLYHTNPSKIVAIGECGLDYVFHANDLHPEISLPPKRIKHLQKMLFQSQINLAKKLNLPLVIHVRDNRSKNPTNSEAWDTALDLVGDYPTVLHCYSGLLPTTLRLRSGQANNFSVSFAGNLTFPKNGYLREAVKLLPLEKIILETDAPFLSPQSKRGQRNEPANVKEIAEYIAQIKGVSFEEVARQTTENTKKIFNI